MVLLSAVQKGKNLPEGAPFQVISYYIISVLYMLSLGSFWLKVLLWQDSGKRIVVAFCFFFPLEKTLNFKDTVKL